MNILLTNYMETLSPGGINKVVSELGKGLSNKGHTVTVLQGNPRKLAKEEIHEGFRVIRIGSPLERHLWGLNGKLFFYLRKHLGELDPHVIHFHGHHLSTPEIIYAVKRLDCTIPTVVNYHIDIFSGEIGRRLFWSVYTKVAKNVAKAATHIVADSDSEADYVRRTFEVSYDKISTIHLGVDPFFQERSALREKSQKDEVKLLFVGYLVRRKNIDAILCSLRELVYRFEIRKARLTIVGTGPERGKLLRLAHEMGISQHIEWKECLNTYDLIQEFSEADVFLLLSKSEAYGLAVAEALSVGTPCIVTNTAALREFTEEPGCFGVESPPDPRRVAQLILRIRENQVQVGPLSDKIRTWERVVQDYEVVYQKVLRNDSRHRRQTITDADIKT